MEPTTKEYRSLFLALASQPSSKLIMLGRGIFEGVFPLRRLPLWCSPVRAGRCFLRLVHLVQPFHVGAVSAAGRAAWLNVQDVPRGQPADRLHREVIVLRPWRAAPSAQGVRLCAKGASVHPAEAVAAEPMFFLSCAAAAVVAEAA